MAHNLKRAARMAALTNAQLRAIVAAKSLSSAAAAWELKRRENPPPE